MNKWIPVEMLPKINPEYDYLIGQNEDTGKLIYSYMPARSSEVLVYCPDEFWIADEESHILTAHYDPHLEAWYFATDSHYQRVEPTHWMPLPDPPKSEEEEIL